MHTYDLDGLGEEIPDEFDFQVKITSFMTNKQGVRMPFLNDTKRYDGTWAFKVPVKINRELRLRGGNTYEGEKKYFFNKVNENSKNIRAVLY